MSNKYFGATVLLCLLLCLALAACGSEQVNTSTPTFAATTPSIAVKPELSVSQTSLSPTTSSRIGFAPTVTPLPTPTLKRASPQDWQYRWLKGVPCRPPCFEGITPGQVSATEALKLLLQNPLVASAKIYTFSVPPSGSVAWNWAANLSTSRNIIGSGGDASFDPQSSDQIIYEINPALGVSFTLSEVIKAYGEPSHIIASVGADSHGHGLFYATQYVYLSQGFVVATVGGDINKPVINNDTLLVSVNFFTPTLEGFNTVYKYVAENPQLLVRWQGFQSFEFYCRYSYYSGIRDCSDFTNKRP